MGLFTRRKSRATRRAEAKALQTKARLQARYEAKNDVRRIKAERYIASQATSASLKAAKASDKAKIKVAETELKAAREGKLLSPTRIKRSLTVTRLLAPVLVPVAYRTAIAVRGYLDEQRADRLGVPLAQLGQYSGESGVLSARVAGAEKSLRALVDAHPKDAETKQFAAAIGARLVDLQAAITASETMPPSRRHAAQAAVAGQLDGIEADLLARLGVG